MYIHDQKRNISDVVFRSLALKMARAEHLILLNYYQNVEQTKANHEINYNLTVISFDLIMKLIYVIGFISRHHQM